LRTEEPEPESDSCIKRSRLPGALPKRRLRLASRLPSPRASLQASGTPTCSALEPESRRSFACRSTALSDRPGQGPASAGDPRDQSRPGPASAGDPETVAGLASAECLALAGRPVALLRGPALRREEPEPESDSCIKRSRLPGALPKRRSRLASRLPSPRASLQASGTPTCVGVGIRV
jgi:hypothetical protein